MKKTRRLSIGPLEIRFIKCGENGCSFMNGDGIANRSKRVLRFNMLVKAIEHCIDVDFDRILADYDSWDEYLGETIGATEKGVRAPWHRIEKSVVAITKRH